MIERLPEEMSATNSEIACRIFDLKFFEDPRERARRAMKASRQEHLEDALLCEDDAFVA